MIKRIVVAFCWFMVTAWAYNYLSFYLGLPQLAGLLIAAAMGAFVGADPAGVLRPKDASAIRRGLTVGTAESPIAVRAT